MTILWINPFAGRELHCHWHQKGLYHVSHIDGRYRYPWTSALVAMWYYLWVVSFCTHCIINTMGVLHELYLTRHLEAMHFSGTLCHVTIAQRKSSKDRI